MSKFKEGDHCAICDKPWVAGSRFAAHHLQWIPVELTAIVCFNCHLYLHGHRTFPYKMKPYTPRKKKDITIEQKDAKARAPYEFAKRVVAMYRPKRKRHKPVSGNYKDAELYTLIIKE